MTTDGLFITSSSRRRLVFLLAVGLVVTPMANAFAPPSTLGLATKATARPTTIGSNSATVLHAGRRGGNRGNRGPPVKEQRPPMNAEITATELRVVVASSKKGSEGKDEPLGVMTTSDALAKAKEMGNLDLILINNNSDPPVCKIVDYSKYRYMKEKASKEKKKNSKASEVKEIKMSYKIDVHDYDVRKKNASRFLKQGNRVKCTVMFRGREVTHDKLGFELLDKLAGELDAVALKEGRPKREGRNLSLMLGPRPEVVKAVTDGKRKEEKDKKKKRADAFKEKQEALDAEASAAAAAKAASDAEEAKADSLLNALQVEEDDDDDGEAGKDVASSLDDLLGSDDLMDDLFS